MEGIVIGAALLAGAVAAPVALALVVPAIVVVLVAQLAASEAEGPRRPTTPQRQTGTGVAGAARSDRRREIVPADAARSHARRAIVPARVARILRRGGPLEAPEVG